MQFSQQADAGRWQITEFLGPTAAALANRQTQWPLHWERKRTPHVVVHEIVRAVLRFLGDTVHAVTAGLENGKAWQGDLHGGNVALALVPRTNGEPVGTPGSSEQAIYRAFSDSSRISEAQAADPLWVLLDWQEGGFEWPACDASLRERGRIDDVQCHDLEVYHRGRLVWTALSLLFGLLTPLLTRGIDGFDSESFCKRADIFWYLRRGMQFEPKCCLSRDLSVQRVETCLCSEFLPLLKQQMRSAEGCLRWAAGAEVEEPGFSLSMKGLIEVLGRLMGGLNPPKDELPGCLDWAKVGEQLDTLRS